MENQERILKQSNWVSFRSAGKRPTTSLFLVMVVDDGEIDVFNYNEATLEKAVASAISLVAERGMTVLAIDEVLPNGAIIRRMDNQEIVSAANEAVNDEIAAERDFNNYRREVRADYRAAAL